ncbi:hypothetical protein DH2020_047695 [Rehmannia glutinosa]|uniref:DUF4283 domain-containing protein n=1 Tax=Rehmannia glutinosa TaxID=99300 RepID=A0ABR0U7Y5_REHGL
MDSGQASFEMAHFDGGLQNKVYCGCYSDTSSSTKVSGPPKIDPAAILISNPNGLVVKAHNKEAHSSFSYNDSIVAQLEDEVETNKLHQVRSCAYSGLNVEAQINHGSIPLEDSLESINSKAQLDDGVKGIQLQDNEHMASRRKSRMEKKKKLGMEKISNNVKKSDAFKRVGVDKMSTRSTAKAGKLVHNFLTKGGGSRGHTRSSGHSESFGLFFRGEKSASRGMEAYLNWEVFICYPSTQRDHFWKFANPSHIIIKVQSKEDFNRLWMGTIWSIQDCPIRVFKWTTVFNLKEKAPLAPVWIRLPGLSIHFFDYHALYSIAKEIGTPLQVDSPTAKQTRLTMARICIELDLLKERMEEIVLRSNGVVHVQRIVYERVPEYCDFCKHVGHNIQACYMNGNNVRPPPPVRQSRTNRTDAGNQERSKQKQGGNFDISKGINTKQGDRVNPPSHAHEEAMKKGAPNPNGWTLIQKKGPKETGFISKEILEKATKSGHTYFPSNSNMDLASSNQFEFFENESFAPVIDSVVNGQDFKGSQPKDVQSSQKSDKGKSSNNMEMKTCAEVSPNSNLNSDSINSNCLGSQQEGQQKAIIPKLNSFNSNSLVRPQSVRRDIQR